MENTQVIRAATRLIRGKLRRYAFERIYAEHPDLPSLLWYATSVEEAAQKAWLEILPRCKSTPEMLDLLRAAIKDAVEDTAHAYPNSMPHTQEYLKDFHPETLLVLPC